MASTFPGMNPYLEHAGHWNTFHCHFVVTLSTFINETIGPSCLAKLGVRLIEPERLYNSQELLAAHSLIEPLEHAFVEIVEADSMLPLTIVDLARPTSKIHPVERADDVGRYHQWKAQGLHVIELDFVRAGQPLSDNDPTRSDYRIVRMKPDRAVPDVTRFSVRDALPIMHIPRRPGDGELPVPLQPLLDDVVRRGRYERYIYNTPLEDPIAPEDRAWAESIAASVRDSHRPSS